MSTVQEIQVAIAHLPEDQLSESLNWIHTQHESFPEPEEGEIMAEAAQGQHEIDAGQGIPLEDLRQVTPTWTTR